MKRNASKKVLAEYTIELYGKNKAKITAIDNGDIFNITDSDLEVTSLRSYVLAGLMSVENENNITTTSFNRNIFNVGVVRIG